MRKLWVRRSSSQAHWTFTFSQIELKGKWTRIEKSKDWLSQSMSKPLASSLSSKCTCKSSRKTPLSLSKLAYLYAIWTQKKGHRLPSRHNKKTCKMPSYSVTILDESATFQPQVITHTGPEFGGKRKWWRLLFFCAYSFCRRRFAALTTVQAWAIWVCSTPNQVPPRHHFAQSPSISRNTSTHPTHTHTNYHPGKCHSKLHMSNSWFYGCYFLLSVVWIRFLLHSMSKNYTSTKKKEAPPYFKKER